MDDTRNDLADRQLFIVRVWFERSGDETVWRAAVRHEGHGVRRYFSSRLELLLYLEENLMSVSA